MAHEPLRSASVTRRGDESDSSRQIGDGQQPGQLGVGNQIGRRQRLLDAQHVEIGQPTQHRHVLVARAEGAVGVDLEHEVGMVGPHGPHRLERPARLDLQPHPGRAGPHRGVDLAGAARRRRVRGDPDDGADRHRLEARPRPRAHRPASGRPARSSASATAISKAAASMRSTGEPPKSWATPAPTGSSAAPGRRGLEEAAHAQVLRGLSHRRGAAGSTAVPSARAAHSPQPSASSVTTRTKSSGRTRCTPAAVPMAWRNGRSTWTSSTPPVELHGARRSHPATVDGSLYDRAFSPGWRNGRRGGLKSRCPKGRAGSSPAPGTVFPLLLRGSSRRFFHEVEDEIVVDLVDPQVPTPPIPGRNGPVLGDYAGLEHGPQ